MDIILWYFSKDIKIMIIFLVSMFWLLMSVCYLVRNFSQMLGSSWLSARGLREMSNC